MIIFLKSISILGINKDVRSIYESIDKETWTTTDRQIEVDIPRCHQVSEKGIATLVESGRV